VWQIGDAVDTVVCAPDDGRKYHPKHVEQFPDINKLCNVASCWIYIGILLGAHCILHISRIKVKTLLSTSRSQQRALSATGQHGGWQDNTRYKYRKPIRSIRRCSASLLVHDQATFLITPILHYTTGQRLVTRHRALRLSTSWLWHRVVWYLQRSCLSICLSTWNNSAPTGRILMKFVTWVFLGNMSRKLKYNWNLMRKSGALHENQYTCLIVPLSFLIRMRNFSVERCRENQNQLCSITFFL